MDVIVPHLCKRLQHFFAFRLDLSVWRGGICSGLDYPGVGCVVLKQGKFSHANALKNWCNVRPAAKAPIIKGFLFADYVIQFRGKGKA